MALWQTRRAISNLLRSRLGRAVTRTASCAFSTRASDAVFVWGSGYHEQLGHGLSETLEIAFSQQYRPKLLEYFDGAGIKQLAFGATHSAALDAQGRLFTWGSNEYYQLGLGSDKTMVEPCPRLVEALSGIEIVDVSCGERHTAAVDREGKVYTWGWGGSFFQGAGGLGHPTRKNVTTPQLVRSLVDQGVAIASIACGGYHSVALSHDGEVLTWGNGEHGELGHGWGENRNEPKAMNAFAQEDVTAIAAGYNFTMAMTESGELYGFGSNLKSQLGTGPLAVKYGHQSSEYCAMETFPALVPAFAGKSIRQFACGYDHSAVVTDEGALFICGSEHSLEPVRITSALEGEHIVQVACGLSFTAALTVDGKVFTMGEGLYGCLGHGSRSTERQPRWIEALANERVTSIVCGSTYVGVTVS